MLQINLIQNRLIVISQKALFLTFLHTLQKLRLSARDHLPFKRDSNMRKNTFHINSNKGLSEILMNNNNKESVNNKQAIALIIQVLVPVVNLISFSSN